VADATSVNYTGLTIVGVDAGKDKMGSVAEPAYERWVKQTDACQEPLPDAKGIWSAMDKVNQE
jgi:L-rhamnose mutarotase